MKAILYGYEFSVYCRIVSMVCHEKGIEIEWRKINPFDDNTPDSHGKLHPFRRVPVFTHNGFTLYETVAITRYLDEAFPGPSLQPKDPRHRARMAQIISVVDAYVYWPLVRQFFSHRVFRPRLGNPADGKEASAGFDASKPVLAALENLASGEDYLVGDQPSLADFHLGAMIDYFAMTEESAALLGQYPKLQTWWSHLAQRDSVKKTRPVF